MREKITVGGLTLREHYKFTIEELDNEIWKPIDGYSYEVSNKGKVRNSKTGKILAQGKNGKRGYRTVSLYKNLKKVFYVHRLVGIAFVDGYAPGLTINHEKGDKENNFSDALEWMTQADNNRHSYQILGNAPFGGQEFKGVKNGRAKIDDPSKIETIYEMRRAGKSTKEIAEILKVHRDTIWRILSKRSFQDIEREKIEDIEKPSAQITFNCKNCGKEATKYKQRGRNPEFCAKSCAASSNNKKRAR